MILTVQQVRDRWTTLESGVFRRWNFLYLCCVDLFMIFVLLFQIYLLLSQRECFARRYWLTCRPITRQSTQMLREASEQDLCFSTSCYKALHGFTSDFNLLVVKWISVVRVRFLICCLFVIAVLIVSSIVNSSTVLWLHMLLLQKARLIQSKIPRSSKYKVTSIQRKGIVQIKTIKITETFFVTQHRLSIIIKHEHK